MRTLAVGAVILYHVWPDLLPGGFVGVDVFFVISGFLIVGSLVQELARTGRIRLSVFYAKRIRRLLPASSTVLLATILGAVVLLPQNRWQSISVDVVMSALQVQNWHQAFSVDSYAAATALVSPVQHFWSLAVEEQFYLVIPVILLAGVAVTVKRRFRIETISLWILAAVSLASFIHSVAFSSSQHDMAYFATSTRMWELGAGGIGALLIPKLRLRPVPDWLSGWIGFGLIVYSAVAFSVAMDFPGSIAVVPVAGTLLLLTAGSSVSAGAGPGTYSVTRVLSLRPVTYIGDLSYSLYLWHWPVVVVYVFHLGRAPGIIQGTAMVAISLALAVASYHLVEQKFRHGARSPQAPSRAGRWDSVRRNAFVLAACLTVAASLAALAPWAVVEAKSQQLNAALNLREYPGATAFDPGRPAPVPGDVPVRPDPGVASKDVPLTWSETCGNFSPSATGADQCIFGPPGSSQTMVVVGDSHAAQYVDPLVMAGSAAGWKVQAMVRNGCPFTAAPPSDGTTVYRGCSEQNRATMQRILQLRPRLVVVSGMAPAGYRQALNWAWGSPEELVNGYVQLLKPLLDAGIRVAVVPDSPYPDFSAPDCVQANGSDSPKCEFRVSDAGAADPLQLAGARVPGIEILDMSAYFCRNGVCPAVIGNVLVYRDNHMTNTFAKTLAPALARQLNF
ncbi:acyltransferase family protein [Arthrobacter sp. 2MCAF15]|uniref:acyltransferase family protein n=1 Tax=Arthrobacter sp. 2MCAF15 TaxID=3232984 RepID=UPI003F91BD83